MLGTTKLFNKQNCDGCVIADDGRVMFFHRVYITTGYEPKVGDRVSFLWRASPRRTGGQEAYQIAPAIKSAA
jgi:cold shock CspA family protein